MPKLEILEKYTDNNGVTVNYKDLLERIEAYFKYDFEGFNSRNIFLDKTLKELKDVYGKDFKGCKMSTHNYRIPFGTTSIILYFNVDIGSTWDTIGYTEVIFNQTLTEIYEIGMNEYDRNKMNRKYITYSKFIAYKYTDGLSNIHTSYLK